MAKYKKRADGRYMANVYTHTDKETGIKKFETVYAYSTPELDNKKAEIKDLVNKGIYCNDKGLTVEKWADTWFRTEKEISGIKTKEMYKHLVYGHIIPSMGEIRLRELLRTDIQLLINKNAEHRRICEQLKMCINQMLESAINDGLLYKNVCRNIKLPPKTTKEKRALTETEKNAIEKADLTDKEKAFIYVIQFCGLRRGEALALSRNDISFSENHITVRKVVTFADSKVYLKQMPKTEAGFRNIPMPSKLSSFLKNYINLLDGLYLFEMERKKGFMTKSSYDKFWKKIIKKLNAAAGGNENIKMIHGLTAHVFRHNYATMLFYAGVDIKEAQYLLGHSDVKLTLNIYTHLDKNKTNAAQKLDSFLAL